MAFCRWSCTGWEWARRFGSRGCGWQTVNGNYEARNPCLRIGDVIASVFFFVRSIFCRFGRAVGQTHSLPSFGLSVGWSGLAMCAMWVGFLSFFAGGRKKQNKFPSNLHCPVKKLNPFYFQFITIVSVWSSVFLHLLPTVKYKRSAGFRSDSLSTYRKVS